jgi:hypothetical protein
VSEPAGSRGGRGERRRGGGCFEEARRDGQGRGSPSLVFLFTVATQTSTAGGGVDRHGQPGHFLARDCALLTDQWGQCTVRPTCHSARGAMSPTEKDAATGPVRPLYPPPNRGRKRTVATSLVTARGRWSWLVPRGRERPCSAALGLWRRAHRPENYW